MKINIEITRKDVDLLPEPLIQNYFPGIELYPNKIKKTNIIISNFKKFQKKIIKKKIIIPENIPKKTFIRLQNSALTLKAFLEWNNMMKNMENMTKIKAARIALKNKKLCEQDLEYISIFLKWKEEKNEKV